MGSYRKHWFVLIAVPFTNFKLPDFCSTSACRDFLFHVQEQRMSLTGIDAFLGMYQFRIQKPAAA